MKHLGTYLSICLAAVIFVAAGACATLPDEPGQVRQEIIGGQPDPLNDENVVLVLDLSGPGGHLIGTCTGELITPSIVMTAAHCTAANVPDGIGGNEVVFCDSINEANNGFTNLQGKHPISTVWWDPLVNPDAFDSGHDIALLYMTTPAPTTIHPLPLNRTPLTQANIGQPIRLVGFGITAANSQDPVLDREQTSVTLLGYTDLFVSFGTAQHNTCQGDSGGPAFMTINGQEVIVGVTSTGDAGCKGASNDTRVDTYLGQIAAFVAANDPQPPTNCGADGICGQYCTAPDPDCPCIGDGFCTDACADQSTDPDCFDPCGADGVCVQNGCSHPDPDCGSKVTGDPCTKSAECLSNFCASNGTTSVCAPDCDAAGSCPSGFSCNSASNHCLPSSGGCHVGHSAGGSLTARTEVIALFGLIFGSVFMVSTRRRSRR